MSLDAQVLETLYAAREPSIVQLCIWISELGEWYVVGGLALALALFLASKKKLVLAQSVLVSVVTCGITTFLLKSFIARPRPPERFWAYTESWYSFPSGHAAMATAFWGLLAYLVWQSNLSLFWKSLLCALLLLLILAIGFARLYLGVHYLSDVIGGYILGAACISLAAWSMRKLRS
jgi:membrane-associated phospholipid phosphatase